MRFVAVAANVFALVRFLRGDSATAAYAIGVSIVARQQIKEPTPC